MRWYLFAVVLLGCASPTGSDARVEEASVSDGTNSSIDAQDSAVMLDAQDSAVVLDAFTQESAPADTAVLAQDSADVTPSASLETILPRALYEELFPNRNALFTYDALVAAARFFPTFANEGTLAVRQRELAAFLANISHETTGGWDAAPGGRYAWGLHFVQEVGCESGRCTMYCDATNTRYPCAPGKTYHGRGPMQLSWNYNYGFMGEQLSVNLLADPDLLVRDGTLSFRSALWFWMTPQAPKPSAHDVMVGRWMPSAADRTANREPGFGMTINIINGGLECGRATTPAVQDRVGFFQRYTMLFRVDPGANLYCDQMRPFGG